MATLYECRRGCHKLFKSRQARGGHERWHKSGLTRKRAPKYVDYSPSNKLQANLFAPKPPDPFLEVRQSLNGFLNDFFYKLSLEAKLDILNKLR